MRIDDETCYRALAARDCPLRRAVFRRGHVDGDLLPADLLGAHAAAGPVPVFLELGPGRARGISAVPALPARAGSGHAPVDAVWRTGAGGRPPDRSRGLERWPGHRTTGPGLGTSTRQLRRVVQQEFGVSPVELAQTQRLLLAKQLLTESNLPIIEVAFASGFESVRRFNALFRSHYRLTPSHMRRATRGTGGDCVRLTLAYRPPLAWESSCVFSRAGRRRESNRLKRTLMPDGRSWANTGDGSG